MVKKTTKSPKRRTFAADKHNTKTRVDTANKTNPFDHHVNRLKHDVLGKRRSYEKGGQPLKARTRGIEKVISTKFDFLIFFSLQRKRTLLKEYNSVFKRNTFLDHRIGENDPTLTNDEKLMQRLIAERTVRSTFFFFFI
jgi:nucleolar protein 14